MATCPHASPQYNCGNRITVQIVRNPTLNQPNVATNGPPVPIVAIVTQWHAGRWLRVRNF